MAKERGILRFQPNKKEVIFYTETDTVEYQTLDDFLYCGKKLEVYVSFNELNTLNVYFDNNLKENYSFKPIYINVNLKKRIGLGLYKNNQRDSCMAFYDMKYKIGSDTLEKEIALDYIKELKNYNSGYTGKLRKIIKVEEKLCRATVNNEPSLSPLIYASPYVEYKNVKCFDSCSFYPFLLTQPLPHYDKEVDFTSEEIFDDSNYTYYGRLVIKNLKAKTAYYPLTLVGKNHHEITVEKQGRNIVNNGARIVSADYLILYGFIPHLLFLLKENYEYEDYKISPKLLRFELKIDNALRTVILDLFEKKQAKKRNGLNYDGEKVLLNRVYGFFITRGNNTPAHYSQYVVSKGKLILNSFFHKIGINDMVHIHTDGFKCIGEHQDVVDEYNKTIEFEELGKFVLEDVMQKCVYYSLITAKYIDKEGNLKFKHGGIEETGIQHLYKMSYEQINHKTPFMVIQYWKYDEQGFSAYGYESDFSRGVRGNNFDLSDKE